ncbi:MAG: MSMEG_0570 family nitrogen starvation response protein [Verrucomicrobiota bacterium]
MPETPFTIEFPDGRQEICYSPSSVVKSFFTKGHSYTAEEFGSLAEDALTEASLRVEAKFGFSCGAASSQLVKIKTWLAELPNDSKIKVLHI